MLGINRIFPKYMQFLAQQSNKYLLHVTFLLVKYFFSGKIALTSKVCDEDAQKDGTIN